MAKSRRGVLYSAWILQTIRAPFFVCVLALCSPGPANAAARQWTGGAASGNWSDGGNWSPVGAPGNGDDLRFVRGALPGGDLLTTNDIAGLRLRSIVFEGTSGGFFLRGNTLTLSNGIVAAHSDGTNTVSLPLASGAAQTFQTTVTNLSLTGDIFLNGFDLTLSNAGPCNLSGVIRGASGNLFKTGPGLLSLGGANTFGGTFTISEGEVRITNSAALGTTAGGTIIATDSSRPATLTFVSVVIGPEPLTLGDNAILEVVGGSSSFAGNITLNLSPRGRDPAIDIFEGSILTYNGGISGTIGLRKRAGGTLVLTGSALNTYSGDTRVEDGILQLNKSAGFGIPTGGTLRIGESLGDFRSAIVQALAPNQIPATIPIFIDATGKLDLNGFDATTLEPLTFRGGDLDTGGGTLTLGNTVSVIYQLEQRSADIRGRLNLGNTLRAFFITNSAQARIFANVIGTGGIFKSGSGWLELSVSNSYSGLTIIDGGRVLINDDFALGSTNAGTVVTNAGRLTLSHDTHVGLEPLTLYRGSRLESSQESNSWAGTITVASNATLSSATFYSENLPPRTGILNLSGSIRGSGELTIDGMIIFSGPTRNFLSNTIVRAGTLKLAKDIPNSAVAGNLQIGDSLMNSTGAVQLVTSSQIDTFTRVNVLADGLLELNNVSEVLGSIEGSGQIRLGIGALQTGDNNLSTTFSGMIAGSGDVYKRGFGTWTLAGTNTYTGDTTVQLGTLIVDGYQPQSSVTVPAGRTLGGNGVVGNISAAGNITPGSGIGTLTCSNLAFTSSGTLIIELDDNFHDQLIVRGTNNLGNATLNLFVPPSRPATQNENIDIILNDGTEANTGTFAGLPANAVLTAGNHQLRVSYAAGVGGNDVRLTVVSNELRLVTIQSLGSGNRNATFDPDECNTFTGFVITNVSDTPVTGISATLLPRTPGVSVTQPFVDFPDIPAGARVTNLTAFQVSMLPAFECGTNIRFDLLLDTASHGKYRIPFNTGLGESGEVGPLVRFDNNVPAAIPDPGALNSTITVSGITTGIRQVVVSLHITHGSLQDLDVSLISPAGVVVNLSSDNGGSAANYGTGCADAQRTRFEANASSLISTSVPPFVGTFAPEDSLASFDGDLGAQVNGVWTLRVTDDTGGSAGTLLCWSLFIASAFCPPGSGPCESCPDRIIYGFLGQGSQTSDYRLSTNSAPSTCAFTRSCLGYASDGPYHFDAYSFVNEESNACITVALDAPDCHLFSAAYLDRFSPSFVCSRYMGDIGRGGSNYSFMVNAGARFVVVVTEVVANAGCKYTLTVSGGSCRPVLDIESLANNRVAFDWSTAAIGSSLERSNNLAPPSAPVWFPVTPGPVITDSRFRVTNTISGSRNFYRLRKP